MDKEILERIKESVISGYEESVSNLLKEDIQYQQLAKAENDYEKKYEQIRETLPKDTVDIIDNLLSLRDKETMIYNFWVFIVGTDVGAYFASLLKK